MDMQRIQCTSLRRSGANRVTCLGDGQPHQRLPALHGDWRLDRARAALHRERSSIRSSYGFSLRAQAVAGNEWRCQSAGRGIKARGRWRLS